MNQVNKNIIWFIIITENHVVCKVEGIESLWNDHWSIMKPAYFIIWFSFNNNFRFSIRWCSRLYSANMWSALAVWKQYNKMAILHFLLVNSTLIYILLFLVREVYEDLQEVEEEWNQFMVHVDTKLTSAKSHVLQEGQHVPHSLQIQTIRCQ